MKLSSRSLCFFAAFLLGAICGCGNPITATTSGGSQGTGTKATLSIASVTPGAITAGATASLAVTGTGFTSSTVVLLNGTALSTTFVSSTNLTASVAAGQFAGGLFNITVTDQGVSASNPTLTVEVDNPLPTISGLNPATAIAGAASTDATVAGGGFLAATVVRVNGSARTPTYISSTQLTVTLTPQDLATAGSLALTSFNPTPGGGTSAAASFTVANPAPALITVSPSAVDGGGSAAQLFTVTGANFVGSSVIQVDGVARGTKFVSSTQLSASLTAAEQVSAHVFQVAVTTPAPGGGTTASVPLTIRANPIPVLASFSPTSIVAGSSATLHVLGDNFVSSSTVTWNGSVLPTQFVSATELAATVDTSLTITAGNATIGVTNPPPVGGVSSVLSFQITSAVPTLTSVAPAAVFRSSVSTLITLQGAGFQPTSTVVWNGKSFATTFISPSQISATLLAADLPSTTSATIQVSTSAPGGGTSAALNVPIYLYKPIITSVAETVGSGVCQQIQLTASGQNLPSTGIVVKLNGTALPNPISLGSTRLIVTLPAALGAIANPQLTVESTYSPGSLSDPFTLAPASSVCLSPTAIVSYPETTFGIDAVDTQLGTTAPTISALTLPAGFAAVTPAPYAVPSRFYVTTGSAVAAGAYSVGVTVNGAATPMTLPVTVESSVPSFSISLGTFTDPLIVPVGKSSTYTVSTTPKYDSNGTADFRITLSATGLPAGVSASFQPASIESGNSVTLTLTAAANAPVRQNVPVSIVGTVDGSSASASVADTLDVSPGAGSIPDNRTEYTWTGGTPISGAYDRVHKMIYTANGVWNRIDVISPATHAIVRSIPLASPVAVDLSQDSGTLWIASRSEQIFALDTTSFTLRRYALPTIVTSSIATPNTWYVSEVYTLADSQLLFVITDYTGNAQGAYTWTPGSGTVTTVKMGSGLLRSGDGTKVFGLNTGAVAGCLLNVYSTATSTAATYTVDSGFTGSSYCGTLQAANSDGSIVVANLATASMVGTGFLDSTGQSLGTFKPALSQGSLNTNENVYFFPKTFVFSDDSRTLYQTGSKTPGGSLIATYDVATRTLLGLAPAITSPTSPQSSGYGGNTALFGVDTTGLLFGIQNGGIAFEDSTYFQDYGSGLSTIQGGGPTIFNPQSGPVAGGTPYPAYGYFALQPDVWYGDVRGTDSLSGNSLTLTSPPANASGPVDIKLIYPDGELGYGALGFSYGPSPEALVYSGSAPAGGASSTLTGFGMPADSSGGSIAVGSATAIITSTVGQYPAWTGEAVPSNFVKFTLPANKPGYADLQVQTPAGTATLPKAMFYASSVNDYPFSGTASSVIYDKFRKQVYVVTSNSVLVFSPALGGFGTPLTVPTTHGIFDLKDGALSTDGNYLVLGNAGDGSAAVLNLNSASASYAIALPSISRTSSACTSGPGAVAALSNGRALVLPVWSSNNCTTFSTTVVLDLQAHTQTAANPGVYLPFLGNSQAQGTADGTQVVVNGEGETAFYNPDKGFSSSGGFLLSSNTAAIAADGNILTGGLVFTDNAGKQLGRIAQPQALYGNALTPSYPPDPRTVPLPGTHFNSAGGLLYVPRVGSFDIVDATTGALRMRFSLTQTLQSVPESLAIDEGGRQIFLLTNNGLTVVDLGQALLSVGHLGSAAPVSGGSVQLRGSGFDASTTVLVDSSPAVATFVDENTLTVSLPTLSSGGHDLTLNRTDGSTLTVKGLINIQ